MSRYLPGVRNESAVGWDTAQSALEVGKEDAEIIGKFGNVVREQRKKAATSTGQNLHQRVNSKPQTINISGTHHRWQQCEVHVVQQQLSPPSPLAAAAAAAAAP